MSRMGEIAMMAESLVIDAMAEDYVTTDSDVLNYVNERLPLTVDKEFVESVLDRFFGDDWACSDVVNYN